MKKNHIREIRKSLGMTQDDLAALVGVEAATVQRHETGKRQITTEMLYAYAAALECHLLDILEGPIAPRSSAEKALLEKFRGMEERDREMFSSLLDTYADKNARYTQNKKPDQPDHDEPPASNKKG